MSGKVTQPKKRFRHGWNPDPLDKRDLYFDQTAQGNRAVLAALTLPPVLTLVGNVHMPPVCDQSSLGSCTANGGECVYDWMHHTQTGKFFDPSRLFLYYNSRLIEGTVSEDSGATIRDMMKAIAKYGMVPEKTIPYDIKHFTKKPTPGQYKTALLHQSLKYARVENDAAKNGLLLIKAAVQAGHPVVFGSSIYDSFESPGPDSNGCIPYPNVKTESLLGGHCQTIVGWNDSAMGPNWPSPGGFIVRNSWGIGWADDGYELISYAYLTDKDIADDFWVLIKEEV